MQQQIQNPSNFSTLFEREMDIKLTLEKWPSIKESILQQQSRVKLFQLGDSNNSYFHSCMKGRISQNQIRSLNTLIGGIAHTLKDI